MATRNQANQRQGGCTGCTTCAAAGILSASCLHNSSSSSSSTGAAAGIPASAAGGAMLHPMGSAAAGIVNTYSQTQGVDHQLAAANQMRQAAASRRNFGYDQQEAGSTDDSFVPSLAIVLQHLVTLSPDRGEVTSFHAMKEPDISIHDYLERIAKYFGCSNECFVLSLVYIDRILKLHRDFNVSLLNIHRLVITSVMLAAKFFDDIYYSNQHYARVGGVRTREMNMLEIQFLAMINYNLFVSPGEYEQYRRNVLAAVHYTGHMASPMTLPARNPSLSSSGNSSGGGGGRSASDGGDPSGSNSTATAIVSSGQSHAIHSSGSHYHRSGSGGGASYIPQRRQQQQRQRSSNYSSAHQQWVYQQQQIIEANSLKGPVLGENGCAHCKNFSVCSSHNRNSSTQQHQLDPQQQLRLLQHYRTEQQQATVPPQKTLRSDSLVLADGGPSCLQYPAELQRQERRPELRASCDEGSQQLQQLQQQQHRGEKGFLCDSSIAAVNCCTATAGAVARMKNTGELKEGNYQPKFCSSPGSGAYASVEGFCSSVEKQFYDGGVAEVTHLESCGICEARDMTLRLAGCLSTAASSSASLKCEDGLSQATAVPAIQGLCSPDSEAVAPAAIAKFAMLRSRSQQLERTDAQLRRDHKEMNLRLTDKTLEDAALVSRGVDIDGRNNLALLRGVRGMQCNASDPSPTSGGLESAYCSGLIPESSNRVSYAALPVSTTHAAAAAATGPSCCFENGCCSCFVSTTQKTTDASTASGLCKSAATTPATSTTAAATPPGNCVEEVSRNGWCCCNCCCSAAATTDRRRVLASSVSTASSAGSSGGSAASQSSISCLTPSHSEQSSSEVSMDDEFAAAATVGSHAHCMPSLSPTSTVASTALEITAGRDVESAQIGSHDCTGLTPLAASRESAKAAAAWQQQQTKLSVTARSGDASAAIANMKSNTRYTPIAAADDLDSMTPSTTKAVPLETRNLITHASGKGAFISSCDSGGGFLTC